MPHYNVLFFCTGNSARSIMVELLIQNLFAQERQILQMSFRDNGFKDGQGQRFAGAVPSFYTTIKWLHDGAASPMSAQTQH